jgi:hypothetical protein
MISKKYLVSGCKPVLNKNQILENPDVLVETGVEL